MANVTWALKRFDELTPFELYEALALRQRVFVVEQSCAYLDCDGNDVRALHLFGRSDGGALVGYARLLPPGVAFAEAAIGRVVVDGSARRSGLGRTLMEEAIARSRAHHRGPIRVSAQRYLERFYRELGFVADGAPYDEDGIPHIQMVLPAEPG